MLKSLKSLQVLAKFSLESVDISAWNVCRLRSVLEKSERGLVALTLDESIVDFWRDNSLNIIIPFGEGDPCPIWWSYSFPSICLFSLTHFKICISSPETPCSDAKLITATVMEYNWVAWLFFRYVSEDESIVCSATEIVLVLSSSLWALKQNYRVVKSCLWAIKKKEEENIQ